VIASRSGEPGSRAYEEAMLFRARPTHADPLVVFLTPAGARPVGLPRRRAPRVGEHSKNVIVRDRRTA